jgi:hypothetical protein
MTPQQYDRINGLNALGGCMLMVCIFGIFPVVIATTWSFWLAIGATVAGVVLSTLWINKMKADV